MLVLLFILGLLGVGIGPGVDTGWTLYAPLSIQSGWGMDFRDLLGAHAGHLV